MTDLPPDWYPDPNDPSMMRWWDGRQWTDQTQPSTAVPDAGAAAANAAASQPTQMMPQQGGQPTQMMPVTGDPTRPPLPGDKKMSGGQKALVVIGVIIAVLVILGIGYALGNAGSDNSAETTTTVQTTTTKKETTTTKKETTTTKKETTTTTTPSSTTTTALSTTTTEAP